MNDIKNNHIKLLSIKVPTREEILGSKSVNCLDIERSGFFKILEVVPDERKIIFSSMGDVICRGFISGQGSMEYNFGVMAFQLRIDTHEINYLRTKSIGRFNQETVHCFVSGSSVCFGDSKKDFYGNLNSGKIFEAMNILQNLLTSYQDGANPYQSLSWFKGLDRVKLSRWEYDFKPATIFPYSNCILTIGQLPVCDADNTYDVTKEFYVYRSDSKHLRIFKKIVSNNRCIYSGSILLAGGIDDVISGKRGLTVDEIKVFREKLEYFKRGNQYGRDVLSSDTLIYDFSGLEWWKKIVEELNTVNMYEDEEEIIEGDDE
jgi:hypothetical protein